MKEHPLINFEEFNVVNIFPRSTCYLSTAHSLGNPDIIKQYSGLIEKIKINKSTFFNSFPEMKIGGGYKNSPSLTV